MILTTTFRTKLHGDRVHGVGRGVDLRQYFGSSSHMGHNIDLNEQLTRIEVKITKMLEFEFSQKMESRRMKMEQSILKVSKI